MKRGNILAHRGLWRNKNQQNTLDALFGAIEAGFGVETDIRDLDGNVVISHDPPTLNSHGNLEAFLNAIKFSKNKVRCALNIKSDGLAKYWTEAMKNVNPDQFFFFDMSIPDHAVFVNKGLPTYSRVSDVETEILFRQSACGVWVDNFSGYFDQVSKTKELLRNGLRVATVSPELHGRPYMETWQELKRQGIHHDTNWEICTDFPKLAIEFFGETRDDQGDTL